MRDGAVYKARDDGPVPAQSRPREFPALECVICQYVEPDAAKIAALPPADVPSSVKIRCAQATRRAS